MSQNEKVVIPQLTDWEQSKLDLLWAQLRAKTPRNLLRASYYDGKKAIRQVGRVIPPQYYNLGIVLGWSAKAVDVLARRVNLDGFVWPNGDLDSLPADELWEANYLGAEIASAVVSSLIHSVAFLVTTKGGRGEPAALLHVKDAITSTGEWNARSRRLDSFLSVLKQDKDGPTELLLYLPNLIVHAKRDGRRWGVEKQTHTWGVPVDPLVYKPRVGREFGSSRISRPVMSLHDQALRTVIRLEGHMDVYSFPELWLLGADESIFQNPDGTRKAGWQVMLGRIKAIPDDDEAETPRADVKQFKASDPDPHLAALKQQAMLFSGETSIPLTSLGVSDMSNPTSAESYIASREDLIAEAQGAIRDFGPALKRSFQRLVAMAEGLDEVPAEWAGIDPKWRSPVYLSRAAQADAGVKQIAAVPRLAESEVGLELLGLTPQQIRQAMADRQRSEGRQALRDLLGQLDATGS